MAKLIEGRTKGLASYGFCKPKESNTSDTRETDVSQGTTSGKNPPLQTEIQNSCLSASYSQKAVDKAAIKYILHVVNQNQSLNSTDEVRELFKEMFTDSQIAQNLQIGKTKTKYVIDYGIYPYVLSLLNEMVETSPIDAMVILFDETLNKEQGKKQLDYHIRFWHGNRVYTRYLDSEFMGKATHLDLLEKFIGLDNNPKLPSLEKCIQISMDGPNVNIALKNKVNEVIMDFKYDHKLLDICTCGLHIVHNGFKISTQTSKRKNPNSWQVGQFLQSLHTLFKDCSARVEEYQTLTGATSDDMPQAFSCTRWLENVKPARRGLTMVDNLRRYVTAAEDKTNKQVTLPTNNSFKIVKEFVGDVLAKAKLSCFIFYGKQFEAFLQKYQTDRPMGPYLYEDLTELCNNIAGFYIKATKLEAANHAIKLDVSNYNEVSKSIEKVQTGKEARDEINALLAAGTITADDKKQFKTEARDMYACYLKFMQEKSPANIPLCRYLRCLNPEFIVQSPEKAKGAFCRMLNEFQEAKLIQVGEYDDLKHGFEKFLKCCVKDDAFCKFDIDNADHRLDELFYAALSDKPQFKDLWKKVIAKALVLSHGQATVERGFSQNKEVSEYNQVTESLIARRAIKDHMNFVGGRSKFEISDGLLKTVSQANQKYRQYLVEQAKAQSAEGKKRKEMQSDIDQLKKQRRLLDDRAQKLETEGKKIFLESNVDDLLEITKAKALMAEARDEQKKLQILDDELKKKTDVFNNYLVKKGI